MLRILTSTQRRHDLYIHLYLMRRVIDMIINEYEYLEYALLSTAFHWQALDVIDVGTSSPTNPPSFSLIFVVSLT